MRVLVVMALLFIGAMPPAARTSAYFSSAKASPDLAFQSANVTLGAGLDSDSLKINVSNLFPDDTTGQYRAFAVSNGGGTTGADLRYSVGLFTDSDTSGLAQQLRVALAKVSPCDSSADSTLDGTSSDVFYNGPASFASGNGFNLIGSRAVLNPVTTTSIVEYLPSVGPSLTDRLLTTSGGTSSESLCLRLRLPSNAKTDVQGGSASFTVRFVAVQDAGLSP